MRDQHFTAARPHHEASKEALERFQAQTRVLRLCQWGGAAMFFVIGAVHLNLYAREQYSQIPTIGGLFLANIVIAWTLALALALRRSRLVAGLASLFAMGTLCAYVTSLFMPLFGFEEPGVSYSGGIAIVAEVLALSAMTILVLRPNSNRPQSQWRLRFHAGRNPTGQQEHGLKSLTGVKDPHRKSRHHRLPGIPPRMTNRATATAGAVAMGLLLASCTPSTSPGRGDTVVVVRSSDTSLGTALSTGAGYTLYAFSIDTPTKSKCNTGACTALWPPLLATGHPQFGPGIHSHLMTTIQRRNGAKQLAYAGHPLYTFSADTRPGQVAGQDLLQFGGRWYAVSPSGALLTKP